MLSEPVVKDASEDSDALIADLGGVRGVWQSQSMALFDTHIAPCLICPILLLLCWLQLNLKRNRSITLLLLIVVLPSHLYVFRLMDLLMMRPIVFLQYLARYLSINLDCSVSEILGWLHAHLVYALVQATNACSQGSRTQWWSLGMKDGAAIPFDENFVILLTLWFYVCVMSKLPLFCFIVSCYIIIQ